MNTSKNYSIDSTLEYMLDQGFHRFCLKEDRENFGVPSGTFKKGYDIVIKNIDLENLKEGGTRCIKFFVFDGYNIVEIENRYEGFKEDFIEMSGGIFLKTFENDIPSEYLIDINLSFVSDNVDNIISS